MMSIKKTILACSFLAISLNVYAKDEIQNTEMLDVQHKVELIKKDIEILKQQIISSKELNTEQSKSNHALFKNLNTEFNKLSKYVYDLPNGSNYEQVKDDLKEQLTNNTSNISNWGNTTSLLIGLFGVLITLILAALAGLHFKGLSDSKKDVEKHLKESKKEQLETLRKCVEESIGKARIESQQWLDLNGKLKLEEHFNIFSKDISQKVTKAENLIEEIYNHADCAAKARQELESNIKQVSQLRSEEANNASLNATTMALLNILDKSNLFQFVSNFIKESNDITQVEEVIELSKGKISAEDEKLYVKYLYASKLSMKGRRLDSFNVNEEIIYYNISKDASEFAYDFIRKLKAIMIKNYLLLCDDLCNSDKNKIIADKLEVIIFNNLNDYNIENNVIESSKIKRFCCDLVSLLDLSDFYISLGFKEQSNELVYKVSNILKNITLNNDESQDYIDEIGYRLKRSNEEKYNSTLSENYVSYFKARDLKQAQPIS